MGCIRFGGCGCGDDDNPYAPFHVIGYVVIGDQFPGPQEIRFIGGTTIDYDSGRYTSAAPVDGNYGFYGSDVANGSGWRIIENGLAGGFPVAIPLLAGQHVEYINRFFARSHGQYGLWVTGPGGFDPAAFVTRIIQG